MKFLFIVRSMDEVGILAVYFQDVEHHLPYEFGEGENLAKDGVPTQLLRCGKVEGDTGAEEQTPPLDGPDGGDNGHQQRHGEGDDDQHGTGDEGLLDGLVDEVEVHCRDGPGDIRQQVEETLYLGRHPTQALFLEVLLIADLFVEDMDVRLVPDIYLLLEQQGLQLAVLTGCTKLKDVILEPLIVKAHAGTDEGRGEADAVVRLAEDGVVDFLADTIEDGNIIVVVLGTSVALDGLVALCTDLVQPIKELWLHHVVGIEDDDIVKVRLAIDIQLATLYLCDGVLHGLGLAALLEDGLEERDGQFTEFLVGLGLHVVGDDGDVEVLVGIVLTDELGDGIDDDAVFVIGGIKDEIAEVILLAHGEHLTRQEHRKVGDTFLP